MNTAKDDGPISTAAISSTEKLESRSFDGRGGLVFFGGHADQANPVGTRGRSTSISPGAPLCTAACSTANRLLPAMSGDLHHTRAVDATEMFCTDMWGGQ